MFFFGGALLIAFALRLWLAAFGGVHPDEAYYWTWSRALSMGYFDHPPLIAWLIRAGDELVRFFVPSVALQSYPAFFAQIGLRAFPYFISCVVTPLIIGRCIERAQGRPLGVTQMVALLTAPVLIWGPQVVTPDTPFFMFWSLALYMNLRLIESRGLDAVPGNPTPFKPGLAIVAGIALAGCAYSKHSAILAAFLFTICGTGPFNALCAGLTALVCALPHLLWYRTVGLGEGGGFLFQFNNALGNVFGPVDYRRFGDLVATQVLLWTPVTFLLALGLTAVDVKKFFLPRRVRRPAGTLFLWAFSPVVFFGLTALKRRAEANWALVGVIAALVLVISKAHDRKKALWAVTFSHVAVCLLSFFILFEPSTLADTVRPWSKRAAQQLEKPSRVREFSDWDRFHTLVFEATRMSDEPVLVQSYQMLSGLLFQDVQSPNEALGTRLKIWDAGSRKSQFNLDPERNPQPPPGRYWVIAIGTKKLPKICRVTQTIYKNLADEVPYNVAQCGF